MIVMRMMMMMVRMDRWGLVILIFDDAFDIGIYCCYDSYTFKI